MKNKEYYIRLGEAVERLEEKNCPTDPSKWSYYKSQAKKKFDVYPSAYANGWASKQYGDAGGSWKKCASEATDAQETEFHTQLDKLVHKTFGKRPEEMDEKFDKTHLGILQYAFKDIDRINPSEPAYKRLVDMLNKLSKQELQQIASVDIKFLSLLAKNLLSKKESVNESHFQVGDKVKMSHGGVGVVKSLDKEDGADDEKYYNIELPNGEVMKHAPNELTLVETDLEEGLFQDLMKGVKKGNGPFTLVVIKNNKVVKQVNVNTPQSIPANYTSLQKDYPNSRIRVEDSTGKIVFGESKSVNEGVSRDAAYIHGILQSGQDATQNFIDDNGLDGEKLSDYVKANRNNIDGYNVKHYISGERGTVGSVPKLRQAFIKKFKKGKSVNESSMSNIDIIAQEANDFKDFVKEFYKEYKDFPKDKDTIKWLKGVYDNRSTTESIVNESSVEIGDIVFFPSANSAATVVDRFGRSVTLKLANGKKVKTVVDKIKLLAQDNVNEGNAFTGALFNARKEGLTEFEFNGKKYPVHKLEEEEKEETLAESKLTKDSLKKIIKEEYHNVKTFMEEKYGFTPELGKVYSNLAAKPFLKEEEEEILDEYDVENYQDLKEFVQFMAEYKSDINEAEYQGRKVKLGKIMQGDVKKFKVYVKNDKGNVVKVNFGQGGDAKGGTMRIRKDNPEARKSFRARHNCDTPGPRWKARYWSCRKW